MALLKNILKMAFILSIVSLNNVSIKKCRQDSGRFGIPLA